MEGICDFAIWKGSPNFGYPRGTHNQLIPQAIVYHVMQGTLAGCDSWVNNPGAWASTHFAIGKQGTIHQYVDLRDAAWGNGSVANPNPHVSYLYTAQNPNLATVSVEHEGYSGEPWPEAQYQASLKLTRWLLQNVISKVSLAIPIEWLLVAHGDLNSLNRSDCPGPGWDKERMLRDLKEEPMPKPFTEEQEKRITDIVNWCGPGMEMQARLVISRALHATEGVVMVGDWEELPGRLADIKELAQLWNRWEE